MPITRNEFKLLKSYFTKKGRKTHRKFVAEGVRLLEEAYRFQIFPSKLLYSKSHADDRIEILLQNFKKKDIQAEQISSNDMKLLSDTKSPQGVLGVFKMQEQSAAESLSKKCRRILWCENISDPGNVGTLARSALAFGFDTICISGETADIYSPKVVRSTMGAIFKLTIVKDSTENILKMLKQNNISLLAADMHGKPIHFVQKAVKSQKIAVAIGSEAVGLSQSVKSKAVHTVRIDHSSDVESLNAAVAGSILMNELQKEI